MEEEPPDVLLSSAIPEGEPDEPTITEVFIKPPISTFPLEQIPISPSLPDEIFADHIAVPAEIPLKK